MPFLILLFVVVPIAELWVILQVGGAIGVLPTIALLIADSIVGSWLLRSQGRKVWERFTRSLASGKPPTTEVADGAMILFGGALMLAPGFLTDALGVSLLLPPTRALLRKLALRRFSTLASITIPGRARPGRRPPPAYDVEGTVAEQPAPPRHSELDA